MNQASPLSVIVSHLEHRARAALAVLIILGSFGGFAAARTTPAAQSPAPEFPPKIPLADIPREVAERPGVLPPSVTARRSRTDPERWDVTFECRTSDDATQLHLAGSFNGWSATRTPMERVPPVANGAVPSRGAADALLWRATIELPDGDAWYKFVDDAGRWSHDLRNSDGADDGHGGINSRLRLGADAGLDARNARRADGRIEAAALRHRPVPTGDRERCADGRWSLRVRTLAGDVERVELVRDGLPTLSMTSAGTIGAFEWWETVAPSTPGPVRYTFVFKDGDRRVRDPRIYSLEPSETPLLVTPAWARDAVWYQVMLDRFRNGDPANDPNPVRPWRSEWYASSPWEGRDGATFYNHFVFDRLYGGDLAGLRDRLPYLRDLGVNALYLMPVFQASTPHKYNGRSYLHIDEHFGRVGDYLPAEAKEDLLDPSTWTWTESDRLFLDVLREAKSMGFRVIVDAVFNHTGTDHPAFRDVRERGEKSRFADWYQIKSWEPFEYEGWWGFQALPVFRKNDEHGLASPSLREHIFAVTRRWMDPNGDGDPSDGVDGWRLDVPNEVPIAFWREWRKLVKSINPDAYISGEIWTRAGDYLKGDAFDAVMNYEFAKPAVAWVGNREKRVSASEIDAQLAELRLAYPQSATAVLQNLVDSHDTDRVASMLKNPDRPYNERNREQDGHRYDSSRPEAEHYRRQQLLALLQMTYVGAPMIYYGDEVGMWGAGDPGNRKPMLWRDLEPYDDEVENFVDQGMHDYYRDVIRLRRDHSALRRGAFMTVLVDDAQDLWVFIRADDRGQVLVALNASDRAAVVDLPASIGTGWSPVFGEAEGVEGPRTWPHVEIPPIAGRVWQRPESSTTTKSGSTP